MSASLIYGERKAIKRDKIEMKKKLLCWYWCAVFTERYAGGTDSKNAKDFDEMVTWLQGGDIPSAIKYFSSNFNPDILRSTFSGGRYKGTICLLLKNHPKDFQTTQAISTSLMLNENIEDHHIFPDAYLKSKSVEDWTKRNCVLNRALIDELTNQRIGGTKPPSKYLKEIESQIGQNSLSEILKSQLLPEQSDSSLSEDNYDLFLKTRQEIIAKEIKKVTTSP
jgi:hypothetical protein